MILLPSVGVQGSWLKQDYQENQLTEGKAPDMNVGMSIERNHIKNKWPLPFSRPPDPWTLLMSHVSCQAL